MKTQIIHLEVHDDLISIRDRMGWAKSPRVLLVWPRRGDVSLRPLDLKLLQRHARDLGLQVGLVTRKPLIRDEASALSIPVFASLPKAQRDEWGQPPPSRRWREQTHRPERSELRTRLAEFRQFNEVAPGLRLAAFSIGVMAFLSIVVLFIPSAQITLNPLTQSQEMIVQVGASPDFETVELSGNIPARKVTVTLSAEGSAPITGRQQVSGVSLPVASGAERLELRQSVLDGLRQSAEKALRDGLATGDLLLPETLTFAVVAETFQPPADMPGNDLSLALTVEFSALYLSADDLSRLTLASLDATLSDGFVAVPDMLRFEAVDTPSADSAGILRLRIRATRPYRPALDQQAILRLVQGRRPAVAAQRLESALALDSPPEIRLSPSWWPWLPLSLFRVSIMY